MKKGDEESDVEKLQVVDDESCEKLTSPKGKKPPGEQSSKGFENEIGRVVIPGAVAVHGLGVPDEESCDGMPGPTELYHHQSSLDAEVVMDKDERFEKAVQKKLEEKLKSVTQAEQVQVVTETTPRERDAKKKRNILVAMFVIGAVCVAVILAVVLTRKSSSSASTDAGSDNDPNKGGPANGGTIVSNFEMMYEILAPISGEEAFANTSSPQYEALEWIANEDTNSTNLSASMITERYVLALLYFATGGPDWFVNVGFLSSTSVCDWNEASTGNATTSTDDDTLNFGVRCNGIGSVVEISLGNNNLNGTLPAELSALSSLEGLKVNGNDIYGTLPSSFGDMSQLQKLDIGFCLLSGKLPSSISNLRKLIEFQVGHNEFSGTLPSLIQMESLKFLDCRGNLLTGTIPDFAESARLWRIWVSFNLLTGTIPESIYSSTIDHINVWFNDLSGTISPKIGDCAELTYGDFDSNSLTGELPTEIGLCTNLEWLYWSANNFTSTIPSELGLTTRLAHLWLHENELTGTIPSELATLPVLEWLTLQKNNLTDSMEDFCTDEEYLQWTIEADCGGEFPLVECPCCVGCCDAISSECIVNKKASCDVERGYFELEGGSYFVPEANATCECAVSENDPQDVAILCSDNCRSCNKDGSVCAENVDYSFKAFNNSALWKESTATFQYVVGRNDTVTLKTNKTSLEDQQLRCEVLVNDQVCNSCIWRICLNGVGAFEVNCENVEGAGRVDVCDQAREDKGPLAVFALQDSALLDGCPPRMVQI